MEIKAIAEKTVRANMRSPNIFALTFLGAYTRKMATYIDSMAAPALLIVVTRRLCGETNGSPYLSNHNAMKMLWSIR